jgi:hypothetical protein
MDSAAMIQISVLIKIGSNIQKLIGWGMHRYTDRMEIA